MYGKILDCIKDLNTGGTEMLIRLLLKICVLPLMVILIPVNLIGKLLLHISVFAAGLVVTLLLASLIICIRNGDVRSSVMAVLFITAGMVLVLMTGLVNVLIEDATGALLKFMVS